MSRIKEYRHVFSGPRGIGTTFRVDLDQVAGAQGELLVCRLLERHPAELFSEFRRWMSGVMSDVARQTGRRVAFAFEPPGTQRIEICFFSPGGKSQPERISEQPSTERRGRQPGVF